MMRLKQSTAIKINIANNSTKITCKYGNLKKVYNTSIYPIGLYNVDRVLLEVGNKFTKDCDLNFGNILTYIEVKDNTEYLLMFEHISA